MSYYSIEIQGRGIGVTVSINEYRLYSSPKAMHGYSTHLNAWTEKSNRLNIRAVKPERLTEGDAPDREQDSRYSIEAIVYLHKQGEDPVRVAGFRRDGNIGPGPNNEVFDTSRPDFKTEHVLNFEVDADVEIIDKPWNAKGAGELNSDKVYQLYKKIHTAFQNGDFETLAALSQSRIDFGAKVFGIAKEAFEKSVLEDLRLTIADSYQWRELVPEKQMGMQVILDGKIIRVLDAKGNPPIRTLPGDDGILTGYDLVIASANGYQWVL
jgi:hypothetical protein